MRRIPRSPSAAVLAAVGVLVLCGTAAAAPPSATPVGYDISYPQCPGNFPKGQAFGIVGVNGGRAYDANPCLAAEYTWALSSSSTTQPKVSFYVNTGNPGPALSQHWPTGAATPKPCDGTWSADCSYDYGWYAAADSFQKAVAAVMATGATQEAATQAAAQAPWWLDVESANSWSSDASLNVTDLQGAAGYLESVGVPSVGIYTNASSWQTITGSTRAFAGYPSWRPGARNLKQAQANCGATITGGRVKYAQYVSGGFDADHACF